MTSRSYWYFELQKRPRYLNYGGISFPWLSVKKKSHAIRVTIGPVKINTVVYDSTRI
jgi:hypothetical protein